MNNVSENLCPSEHGVFTPALLRDASLLQREVLACKGRGNLCAFSSSGDGCEGKGAGRLLDRDGFDFFKRRVALEALLNAVLHQGGHPIF